MRVHGWHLQQHASHQGADDLHDDDDVACLLFLRVWINQGLHEGKSLSCY